MLYSTDMVQQLIKINGDWRLLVNRNLLHTFKRILNDSNTRAGLELQEF